MREVKDNFNTLDFTNQDMAATSKQIIENHMSILDKDVNAVYNDLNQWNIDIQRYIRKLEPPDPVLFADRYFKEQLENGWYSNAEDFHFVNPDSDLTSAELTQVHRKYEKYFKKIKFKGSHTDTVYTVD